MNERVRMIKFEHFRGLPANEFKLKGKNLVILGTNGKGKSAFVDGIEFVFSGQVARFTGAGTGSISHDDAVKNVRTGGDPKVVIALSPSNGEISRKLSSDTLELTNRQPINDFFTQHPKVDGFVLRRAKILDFVCDQDADRYQKFVQLLGITKVDRFQRSFVEAERQANIAVGRTKTSHQTNLALFKDPVSGFVPTNLAQVFAQIAKTVKAFGLEIEKWEDLESRLPLLKAKRPQANRKKIDAITRALVSIETPLAIVPDADVKTVNELRGKIAELAVSSADAPRSSIIEEGRCYFAGHNDETHCPLCETQLEQPLDALLARLKERGEALQELRNAMSKRAAAFGRLKQYAVSIADLLKKDLAHSGLFETATLTELRGARAKALRFTRFLARAEKDDFVEYVVVPEGLQAIAEIRKAVAVALNKQKDALVPPDSAKLEAAIALLERGIASWQDVEKAESAFAGSREILRRTTIARECFSSAREGAIQQVFTKISGKVLDYYKVLHDFADGGEASECTALEFKPTSRAATGGLRLAIQFLGLANSKDPRAFLSEGHLDSLGLCLFLAAVRIFNPPGTLLVLDDVLTSIDKEHRRRVGELLFTEFKDFQIILTTHDDHWNELLQKSARVMGLQNQWQYIQINGWSVDTGPVISVSESSWEFITENLTEANYRNLGGPFRVVLEDFLARSAAKIELKVRFKADGKYTAGDFVLAGIADELRKLLINADSTKEGAIGIDLARVLGQGDLINFLCHNNPGRLEVTFDQARDFISGLRSLLTRCEEHKLIKGK
ncbi:RecF/RecN/SMC N terminal domain-containing protein [Desulfonatronum thiosulfatophilum]|uniref:RecF/RecN/SMC N terminal domain-containing protein n=1 Tax=Desulfonatronum thiosulfatophilum TaxID=617002 RepID=A0A1G6AHZ4_9BACT|nr:AAA family ATPase [Desulfonatronum thiosulfatophilum]SDB07949.1 RecF/RecN/SMC N terminal domain-containing protein [Desulfonatronum thiosulfatophilum]